MNVLRRLAPALIAAGLVLISLGGSQQVRPVSDQSGQIQHLQRLDPVESKFAELHQMLDQHRVCEETGQWDQWPCSQWTPPSQLPR